MSLELIVGPPNSGRAGLVLDRFSEQIEREPLLVVPTSDDVDRLERELCGRDHGLLGGTVTSFPGLFGEVARTYSVSIGAPLSRMQRLWLARAASLEGDLKVLRRSAEREGFAAALEALLGDLQGAGLDAAAFSATVTELEDSGRFEAEIAQLFQRYESLRDGLGRSDQHRIADAATIRLRSAPELWRQRPVLLYGFDDLAREQVELIHALSDASDVTVAIAFEDRPALGARAELLGVLRDELGGEIIAELEPDRSHTESATLFHLERNLFDPEPETAPVDDDALVLLESAGRRAEAELIGRHIATLIAAGADPDEIAIAVRNPDRQAPLMARVLGGLGIPVAAEARIPLASTATGSTLLRLLALNGPEGSASDVVAFLRGPARARPDMVDWLERRVRRDRLQTAEQALESWNREIWALDDLREADDNPRALATALSRIAAEIAERPHARQGPRPSSGPAIELRAASEVRRALSEAAELGDLGPRAAEIAALLGQIRVPLWRGPTEGRVRILSPYRLRATRVSHLFVAGLTDGSFPAPGAGGSDPLLSDERRREMGLPSRRDPAAEERYLFYSCLSRPAARLYLSYSSADESGAAVARSPFLDEVRALLEPPPTPEPIDDALEARLTERIGIGEIAPAPEMASSPRALARAVAALGAESGRRRLEGLELPAETRQAAADAVASALAGIEAAKRPGPLSAPPVLAALKGRNLYGASTLEEYDTCPYRWFVGHELDPQAIDAAPEPLETGGIVHDALENLFRRAPDGARPTAESLDAWVGAAHDEVRAAATGRGWDLGSSHARISLARLDAVLERFLRRDAETGGPMQPDPDLLEVAFGRGEDDPHPPAVIGDFELHGRIDRIDVSTDGKALIRDYKLSTKVVPGARFLKDGKLQLPLYMEAVRGMGLEPIGGVYHPLGATREDRPRGLIVADHKDALVPGGREAHVRTDFVPQEEFDETVAEVKQRAGEIVSGIRTGHVAREPRDGKCPPWCTFAPICRMERAVIDPDEEEEEQR